MPDVTLYTTGMCPYCVAAKSFLKARGVAWTEVRVDIDPVARRQMMTQTQRTSVPQIFIGDTHVGGFDDMVALDRRGGLAPLLAGGDGAGSARANQTGADVATGGDTPGAGGRDGPA